MSDAGLAQSVQEAHQASQLVGTSTTQPLRAQAKLEKMWQQAKAAMVRVLEAQDSVDDIQARYDLARI